MKGREVKITLFLSAILFHLILYPSANGFGMGNTNVDGKVVFTLLLDYINSISDKAFIVFRLFVFSCFPILLP